MCSKIFNNPVAKVHMPGTSARLMGDSKTANFLADPLGWKGLNETEIPTPDPPPAPPLIGGETDANAANAAAIARRAAARRYGRAKTIGPGTLGAPAGAAGAKLLGS